MERETNEPKVKLVANGKSLLPIVTDSGRREREAAFYLAATIRDITGVKPDIYIDTPTRPVNISPALRIAKADNSDRFRVITNNGSVRFLGRSDFAVYDWCERLLGVRYYTKNAKTFPLSPNHLAVDAVDYADWPVFNHRDNWPFGNQIWAKVGKTAGTHNGGVAVHAPHRWFADPDVRTNHPNVFARQPDGSRGEMPLLCYGNPETLAYYKQRIGEHIAGIRDSGGIVDTNRHVITVSHWDTLLDCTCPHCQKYFNPALGMSGYGSPVIWGFFLKNLATWARNVHPDYTVAFLPYLNVCDVPDGLDLARLGNCEAMVCSMPGLAMFKEPSVREREEQLIIDWARVTGRRVVNWHYGCWPREFTSAPYLFGKTIAAHYRRVAPFECGSFVNTGDATAAEKLSNYIWLKCLWNPSIDVDALYDEFARRMFGAAAESMRKLIAMQEDGWARHWQRPHVCLKNTFDVSYTHDDITQMKRLLIEAAEKVKDNPVARTNVAWYAADFAKFFADEERYRAGETFAPLDVARFDGEMTVDGVLDEACWTKERGRKLVAAFGGERVVRETTVWMAWTEKGIAFACQCCEPAMTNLNRAAAYGELQKQDTLEVFFDPSGTTTGTCYRLMVDVRNRLSATADVVWRAPGVRSAVACEEKAWLVEIFVPFAALEGAAAREWRGNVIRWHPGKDAERSRLSTLGGEWNQDRDAFTTWRFIDE